MTETILVLIVAEIKSTTGNAYMRINECKDKARLW